MTRKLTRKEEAFIIERSKDKTASNSEIARRAGYSPKNVDAQASIISRRPLIEERIKQLESVGLDTLEDVAKNGRVEIARVQAAKTLVETSRGKPAPINQNQFGDITINVLKLAEAGVSSPKTAPNL